jgi:hypothetical protein
MAERQVVCGLIDYSFGLPLAYVAGCMLILSLTYLAYFLYIKI